MSRQPVYEACQFKVKLSGMAPMKMNVQLESTVEPVPGGQQLVTSVELVFYHPLNAQVIKRVMVDRDLSVVPLGHKVEIQTMTDTVFLETATPFNLRDWCVKLQQYAIVGQQAKERTQRQQQATRARQQAARAEQRRQQAAAQRQLDIQRAEAQRQADLRRQEEERVAARQQYVANLKKEVTIAKECVKPFFTADAVRVREIPRFGLLGGSS